MCVRVCASCMCVRRVYASVQMSFGCAPAAGCSAVGRKQGGRACFVWGGWQDRAAACSVRPLTLCPRYWALHAGAAARVCVPQGHGARGGDAGGGERLRPLPVQRPPVGVLCSGQAPAVRRHLRWPSGSGRPHQQECRLECGAAPLVLAPPCSPLTPHPHPQYVPAGCDDVRHRQAVCQVHGQVPARAGDGPAAAPGTRSAACACGTALQHRATCSPQPLAAAGGLNEADAFEAKVRRRASCCLLTAMGPLLPVGHLLTMYGGLLLWARAALVQGCEQGQQGPLGRKA